MAPPHDLFLIRAGMRPYGAAYHWSSPRTSANATVCCKGEAQFRGSKFTGYFGGVLKLGQGAFLDRLLILCQQNTLKDSHSLTVKTEAASASDLPFGLKRFPGAFLP